MHRYLRIATELLFPPICTICSNPADSETFLCNNCKTQIVKLNSCCTICSEPFNFESNNNLICGKCQLQPPYFDSSFAPFIYEKTIQDLITKLKFSRHLPSATTLTRLFIDELNKTNISKPQALLCVPLEKSKMRSRGFNQVTEIFTPIAKDLGIPLLKNYCKKTKHTETQSTLNAKKRNKNIMDAFSLKQLPQLDYVTIVDDVITTGATANTIAKLLKNGGVTHVDVWACARTAKF